MAGTTIGIGLTGKDNVGYTSLVGLDDQRGELVVEFLDRFTGDVVETLTPRLVSRAEPDNASDVGLNDELDPDGLLGGAIREVIALVDIPNDTPPEIYDIRVRRRVRIDATTFQFVTAPEAFTPRITILAGDGMDHFTELLGLQGAGSLDATPFLPQVVPHPKQIIHFSDPGSPSPPAAVELVISYPDTKLDVKGVVGQDFVSQKALLTFDDATPATGSVTIRYVSPEVAGNSIALAFETLTEFWPNRVLTSEFTLDDWTFYDADGIVVSTPQSGPAPSFGTIR